MSPESVAKEPSPGPNGQPSRANPSRSTTGAAWLQFAEDERGSLESGKLADLVVIDRDYLTVPEDQIRDIQPVMTIVEGKVAYSKL